MNYKEAIAQSNQGIAMKVVEGKTYSVGLDEKLILIDWDNKKVEHPEFSEWKNWQDWLPNNINF